LCLLRHGFKSDLRISGFARISRRRTGPATVLDRGCANGPYDFVMQNHGKPAFKHRSEQLYVYYWDERDGLQWRGWWLGPHVGGAAVWSFNADSKGTLDVPPGQGWRVPWSGPKNTIVRVWMRQPHWDIDSVADPSSPTSSPILGYVQSAHGSPLIAPASASPSVMSEPIANLWDQIGNPNAAQNCPNGITSEDLEDLVSENLAAECAVCYESLWAHEPSVFVEDGKRLCAHVFCRDCAETIVFQQHGGKKLNWAARLQCPLCRSQGVALVQTLPEILVDPYRWFDLCDVNRDGYLSEIELARGLTCVLPTTQEKLLSIFNESLWASWCRRSFCDPPPKIGLSFAAFLSTEPGSVLEFISRCLLVRNRLQLAIRPSSDNACGTSAAEITMDEGMRGQLFVAI